MIELEQATKRFGPTPLNREDPALGDRTGRAVCRTVDELPTGRENLELAGLWYRLSRKEYPPVPERSQSGFSLTDAADNW